MKKLLLLSLIVLTLTSFVFSVSAGPKNNGAVIAEIEIYYDYTENIEKVKSIRVKKADQEFVYDDAFWSQYGMPDGFMYPNGLDFDTVMGYILYGYGPFIDYQFGTNFIVDGYLNMEEVSKIKVIRQTFEEKPDGIYEEYIENIKIVVPRY